MGKLSKVLTHQAFVPVVVAVAIICMAAFFTWQSFPTSKTYFYGKNINVEPEFVFYVYGSNSQTPTVIEYIMVESEGVTHRVRFEPMMIKDAIKGHELTVVSVPDEVYCILHTQYPENSIFLTTKKVRPKSECVDSIGEM